MTNNRNKLSVKDICGMYAFLCEYEKDIKPKAGHYHIQDDSIKTFLSNNSIFIGTINKPTLRKNYIRYDLRSGKTVSLDDVGHHILQHIRNAIAHGMVVKAKGSYFEFSDINSKQTITARARIKVELFWQLISLIKQTYR